MKSRLMIAVLSLASCVFAAAEPVKSYRLEEMMLAYVLLEAEGTPRMMEQTLQTSLDAQLKSAPELQPYRQAFESYLRRTISYEAQKEELAKIYLDIYTPDGIRELIRFYQSPIGRRKAAAGTRIAVAVAEVTRRKMEENMPHFQQQMQQEMQKRQLLEQPKQEGPGPRAPAAPASEPKEE